MSELICWLPELKTRHQFHYGSKAVNLGIISRKSMTAPGFCLSTAAYLNSLNEAGVLKEITQLAEGVQNQDLDSISQISRQIDETISRIVISEKIEEALQTVYEKLIQGRSGIKVAVRSSATAEDLPSASFAGQLESYLNIENFTDVKAAVLKCWCSLWTPRAIHYRFQKGIGQANIGMAVIVQEMVLAQFAGVMFTANLLTNSRKEIYIEAVQGLGESLVQGNSSGDRYLVTKEKLFITAKATKEPNPYLVDFYIRQLAHEGQKLEYLFGDYQDIEWAYSKGEIYILQARPITTLEDEEPEPVQEEQLTPIQKEIWVNVNERFPEPVLPLDTAIAKIYYLSLFEAYAELGFSVPVVNWRRVEEGIFPDFFVPPAIKLNFSRAFHLGRMLNFDIAQEWKHNEAVFDRYIKLMQQEVLTDFPMEIILEYLEDGLKDFQRTNTFRYLLYIQYGGVYNLLGRLLNFLYGSEGRVIFEDIVAGHPQVTMELNAQLAELASQANSDSTVKNMIIQCQKPGEIEKSLRLSQAGKDFLQEFHFFMERYGDRELTQGLGGIAAQTWRDKPEVVWGILKGMLLNEQFPLGYQTKIAERREAAEGKLQKLTSRRIAVMLPVGRILNKLVGCARKYTAFREDSHFYLTQAMRVFRALFLAIGRQLVKRGYLEDQNDIMYFTYWELKDLLYDIYSLKKVSKFELQGKLISRKQGFEKRKQKWLARNISLEPSHGEIFKGIGASSGKATGTCRVVLDPRDLSRLRSGDILVAQYSNPSWTPVFAFIGGLVVEYGSAISHAAIVAREYGIPAVLGVPGATGIFKDDELISIDGSQGLVQKCLDSAS